MLESFNLGMCPLLTTGAIQEVRVCVRVFSSGLLLLLVVGVSVARLSLSHPARVGTYTCWSLPYSQSRLMCFFVSVYFWGEDDAR